MTKSFELNVPTSLNHITLGQYQEYLVLVKDKENVDDKMMIDTICLFCNIEKEKVLTIAYGDVKEIYVHLMSLFENHTPLIREFTLKDLKDKHVTFAFVPKLEDMTMGEFVDLDHNIKDLDNMHKAMSVLYRPLLFRRKDLYEIKPYLADEEISKAFKFMPLDVALGAMVFFYRLGKELAQYTMDCLLQQAQKEEAPIRKDLEKNGVGINQFTHSLKEMSDTLMRLPNSPFSNAYYG